MIFLIAYGIILLAMSMLTTGLYESKSYFFPFNWVWIYYFGKLFALIFIQREEPRSPEQREALLAKEIDSGMQTYIPWSKYIIYGLLDCSNAFLICLELVYMSFGLFIMCQAICLMCQQVFKQSKNQIAYTYCSLVFTAGVFSLADMKDGNEQCYVGLVAAVFQLIVTVKSVEFKEQFLSNYIYMHSKLIGFTGALQFVVWSIALLITQYIPCNPSKSSDVKCPNDKLTQTQLFFQDSFHNGYMMAVFVLLIFVGSPLSYIDNKVIHDKLSSKKQVVQQLLFFPVQLWLFLSQPTQDKLFFPLAAVFIFLAQWSIAFYMLSNPSKLEEQQYQPVEDDEDSEVS